MAPPHSTARTEREKKLKAVLTFAAKLENRFHNPRDARLSDDLQTQIRSLPLPASSTVAVKQDELDRQGTELWNLSTRLRRDDEPPNGRTKEEVCRHHRAICLLRVFSFLLLDSAGGQATQGRERKTCIRLMKVALKAARVCIENNDMQSATKVLERAADYQETLSQEADDERSAEAALGHRLRVEYFALRTTLAWRQDRMDIAEHMFAKSKQLTHTLALSTAETVADLLFEMGKDLSAKRNYELAVRWLERAYDVLGEQDLELLSPEAGELRLSIMQSLIQVYMKLKTTDSRKKAWDMLGLLEADYAEKLAVSLLKLELLWTEDSIDSVQVYSVILRMIRTVVLNETNFKTIMHNIHKLKDHSNASSCKSLDDLIEIRLFREENQNWIEKAFITRIWLGTTSSYSDNCLETLHELFEMVSRNTKGPLSAPATHAAQTLLWKRVEASYSQEQHEATDAWCRICLHPLFDKAGELNRSKIIRKMILCALARQDYAVAQEAFGKMSDTGKDEPITRYLMYKVGLHSGDSGFASDCLDIICRQSSKDATLLYACVLEAQASGDKQQAVVALKKVLEKHDYSAPAGIHLPALLRCTTRLLVSELVKDGNLDSDVVEQICNVFDGACKQAKASRRRPSNAAQQLFTASEFEWFSKNAYNLSIKYCGELHPASLVRLLKAGIEFIKLLQEQEQPEAQADLSLRLMFCNFLVACSLTTLARAEDNIQKCLQYYLEVSNHGQEFRRTVGEVLEKLGESAKTDIIAKHFQVVKLELEAALKLEKWDELDALFEQCWVYKSPDHYEALADLILVIHSCVLKADLDAKYQSKLLSVLQKIINFSWRQTGNDIVKLSRWIRCLFQLALTFDENISLKCLEQAGQVAASRQGALANADAHPQERNHYPTAELEWLATTGFNHAVDYYVQENDAKCKLWAEKALNLAQWTEQGNQLRDLLMEKYSRLTWDH
ncbi:meiosis protein SPO22/ZIP4 like-domain-containing protein [Massariosphaeria phaeospora]|uniref:Protein ZIP4 homolog n=1 Tax=Massariosphaeria phaeospora TaxID=100035 RepID=A0A7C8IBE7_9PLEO|nr:meiosis protein SPO22/ZIP4 like-domain-containing protein [Massariosphaeria phaeospora]